MLATICTLHEVHKHDIDGCMTADLSCGFTISVGQRHHTLVDLDAWDDALAFEKVNKWLAICATLVESLLKEDLARTTELPSLKITIGKATHVINRGQ